MTVTTTGLDNSMVSDPQLINLTRLVALILDPLRHECGRIDVTSAFRSEAVNEAVGGSATSYHRYGLAADIMSPELHIIELSDRVEELGLPFDKMIMEYRGELQWVHIQLKQAGNKNRYMIYTAAVQNGEMVYTEVT
jgi:hypothetical protein